MIDTKFHIHRLRTLLCGRGAGAAAHADEWLALARVVGVPQGDQGPAPQPDSPRSFGARPSQPCEGGSAGQRERRTIHDMDKLKRERMTTHDMDQLKSMALTAMANLGGQASSKQLRKKISRMPEISELSSSQYAKDYTGRTLWQRTVVRKMVEWFERGETARAYRLQGSASSGSFASQSYKIVSKKNNSGLKRMALVAMANLGGQASSKKLREEISRMPESSKLSPVMSTDHKGMMMWERTVTRNMGDWFERSETTQIFQLRGSTRT